MINVNSICKFCGRRTTDKDICDICRELLCELCGKRLSRGYCSICGRLVCDIDSQQVGFARVCRECIDKDPKLVDYSYFRDIFRKKARLEGDHVSFRKVLEIDRDDAFGGEFIYVHIGLDDFDSPFGMCTTYAGAILANMLDNMEIEFMDYPLLVRLNPNVPFKTRGNASIGLRLRVESERLNSLKELVLKSLERMSHSFFGKTRTSIVFYITEKYAIDSSITKTYRDALRSIVSLSGIVDRVGKIRYGHLEVYSADKSIPRGMIGALGAIGCVLEDYTYELIAYRTPDKIGCPREINVNSVVSMDKKYWPRIFDSVEGDRLLISPTGPDPVLFGIRGDFPDLLLDAFKMIKHEDISLWCIFRTNQATAAHIKPIKNVNAIRPYETILIKTKILEVKRIKDKVLVKSTADGKIVESYIYRLQRKLQHHALELRYGDEISLVLAVTHWFPDKIVGNVEEFIPLKISERIIYRNPPCPICSARMKKKSKEELYCRRCGLRIRSTYKVAISIRDRYIKTKHRYVSPPRAHRHLTLPNERFIFRKQKLLGTIKPYLIRPFNGRQKPVNSRASYIRTITQPRIV